MWEKWAVSEPDPDNPRIYFLPNLMTAGNLCCGFLAVLTIFSGIMEASRAGEYDFRIAHHHYEMAILYIFGSCLFDLLDGRLARLGGQDSAFGREFDSLADIISFGMAPAMLVSKAVLFPLPGQIGWGVAFVYLLCGAMRLARFNCIAAANGASKRKDTDFRGIPIPMAAGFIASLTFLIIDFEQNDRLGNWEWVLAGAMLALSLLMISNVRYPSFKNVDWRTKSPVWAILIVAVVVLATVRFRYVMPVVLFSIYLLYGLVVRPFLPRRIQKEIEVVGLEEDEAEEGEVDG